MDFTNLREFMDYMAREHTVGNSICIYKENKKVFEYCSGYNNYEAKTPLRGDEMYYIYSCSKVATVTAMLQLVEKGIVKLSDKLSDYIPEFETMYIKDDAGNTTKATTPITIKHLLTMTAGLTYNFREEAFEKARALTNGHFDTLPTIKCLAGAELWYNPGDDWKYSLAHDVLGAVIEVVTGKKFGEYMQENIFGPLEIEAGYDVHKYAYRLAELYHFVPLSGEIEDIVEAQKHNTSTKGKFVNENKHNSLIYGDRYESGGAGIITTVPDYAKLASALANDGVGANGARILKPETIKMMCENHFHKGELSQHGWTHLTGYGYGLGVRIHLYPEISGCPTNVGEFGWCGAAGAALIADPTAKLGVFYAQHTLNPRENYYFPLLKKKIYECL